MGIWIDTHCHLDAPEFAPDRLQVIDRAAAAGVGMLVLPAVAVDHFKPLQALARQHGFAYALGIHPLFVDRSCDEDLDVLRSALQEARDDPLLAAVGEIGLDYFVPGLDLERQRRFYTAQLRLARESNLPVILHVRRSVDAVLHGLRRVPVVGGIAHAFNGSEQQAQGFLSLGFKLGFGGAMTFERALRLRHLAQSLPLDAIVLETDAPDIPPHWLYQTASNRAQGKVARNEPMELPKIGQTLANLRALPLAEIAQCTFHNAHQALPALNHLPMP